MRKGMTATQVIIALALGLIVIVGLGYLVWTWIVRGGGEANEQYCKTKAFTYCSQARIKDTTESFWTKNSECETIFPDSDFTGKDAPYCEEILRITPTTTTP